MYLRQMNEEETQILHEVSRDALMEYTRGVSRWVRISSLQEEVDSLKYLRGLLDSFGYHTEMPEYMGYISYPVKAFVTIESPVERAFKGISACFTPSTPIGGIVAEAADCTEADYRGKIVLMDGLANAVKIKEAEKKGAVAVLFLHDRNIHNGPASDIWGNPTQNRLDTLPAVPVVSVTKPDGAEIRRLLKEGHVKVRVESTVVNEWRKCPLLIADLECPRSDKFVLFSGHIDSWDYGAMDNGSANATMIECARLMAQRKDKLARGLRIAFWSGHSQGKYAGSAWYADHHFEELRDHCAAHLNIDSVGGENAVVVEEPPVMAQAWDLAKDVIEGQTGVAFSGKRMARNADQSFFGVGITSIFGTFSEQDISTVGDSLSFRYGEGSRAGGLGWWWHTEHDTIDKINPELLVRDCRLYAAVLWRLLTAPVLPFVIGRAVEEMKQTVDRLQDKLAGTFDFSPLQKRLDEIAGKAADFDALCRSAAEPCEEAEALTDRQMKLCRNIVRLVYHENDVYDFDLCGPLYPLPNLECGERLAASMEGSSRYYLYLTQLQKGYNRVMEYCGQILELL